jgi:hypothetical protein
MDGTDSNTAQDKNHVGVFSVYTTEDDVKFVKDVREAQKYQQNIKDIEVVFIK